MTSVPDVEDTPRLAPDVGGLYYSQHDVLTAFCSRHGVSWNAGLPSFVVGVSLDSNQSLLYTLLIYAAVQKYKREKLAFPRDAHAWFAPLSLSNAVLNARMYEWMMLSSHTEDEMFNVSDDCAFTWASFWPRLAKWQGIEYTGPSHDTAYRERPMPGDPAPNGLMGRSVMRSRFSFVAWGKDPGNQLSWKQLAERHGLRDEGWDDIGSIFGRADFALLRPFASIMR